ncbi:MAG TPA: amidohydrolase family protein [Mycobacteriales bacterium]|nr:amidohydrolase family protein [Mycobacteriales bacterium]
MWPGGATTPQAGWAVLLDPAGVVDTVGPATGLPDGVRRVGGAGAWVGPGIVDAHVHLAFGAPEEMARSGVVAVRDLGAPPALATGWRTSGPPPAGSPHVEVAGPILTAPRGYPSTSWGRDGFARFVDSPVAAERAVGELADAGVDVVKVALEPAGGQPVPPGDVVRAVVAAAHRLGLEVTAHALTVAMVRRALEAGVDELCHTPVEPLPPELVDRIAGAGVSVVSTIQTLCSAGAAGPVTNARALIAGGVRLVYGTDLGNAGTRTGVDERELARLAEAGLGALGALRAATEGSASRLRGAAVTGRIEPGRPADVVVLRADPLVDPAAWRSPSLVLVGGRAVGEA